VSKVEHLNYQPQKLEHRVTEKTVRNAGQYAEAVEAITKAVPHVQITAPRQAVIKAAAILEKSPTQAAEILSGGKSIADVKREEHRAEIIERTKCPPQKLPSQLSDI
jgi:hypothetical protein